MTREAELLIDMWDTLHRECHKVVTEENYDVIKKAIKALEQEPILDKIKAEIEQLPTEKCTETCSISIDADVFKENVLAIIDKYKTETEE